MSSHDGAALGRRVVRGMLVIIFFGVFLKLGSLITNRIISAAYGPGTVFDAYTWVLNQLILVYVYSSVLKVVIPAFMPVFAEEREKVGEEAAWRLTNTILNMLLVAGALIVVFGMLFSDQIVSALVTGFNPETQACASTMLRYALPSAMVLLFAVMALGILNSYKIFSYPSAANAAHRFAWVVVLLVMIYGFGKDPHGAVAQPVYIGFLVGSVAQLVVLLFGLRHKLSFYRLGLPAMSPARIGKEIAIALGFAAVFCAWILVIVPVLNGNAEVLTMTGGTVIVCAYALFLWARASKRTGVMAKFAALAGPLIIGVLFARYRDLVTAYFQSLTQSGGCGSLEAGKNIVNVPTDLLPVSLSVAMFPYLCDLAAKKDIGAFGHLLTRTVNLIGLFFVPLTVVVIVLGRPIFELVYDSGNWSDNMLTYAGLGLALYGCGFFFYAVENVLMQSYFSMQRVWTPTLVGIGATAFHAAFLFVLIVTLGLRYPFEIFVVVALSFPVSRAAKNFVLIALLRRRISFLPVKRTAVFAGKLCVVSLGVGLAAYLTLKPVQHILPISNLKPKVVMLDTFNSEPRGWTSGDADSIHVLPDVDAQTERFGMEGNALVAEYPWREGHTIGLKRDLSDFDLRDTARLKFAILRRLADAGESDFKVLVYLRDRSGKEYQAECTAAGFEELEWKQFRPLGLDPSHLVEMRIESRLEALGRPREHVELILDNVAFVGAERSVTVDDFEPASRAWSRIAVSSVPNAEKSEMALCVADKPVQLVRRLDDFRLSTLPLLTFKAQAIRPYRLSVALVGLNGERYEDTVNVRASDHRERYEVPLAYFEHVQGFSGGFRELRIEETPPAQSTGTLWLDNIAFERPAHRLMYELTKLAIVTLPSFAALLAFVVLCWLLKVEEAAMVLDWLRRRGWRERGRGGEPTSPAAE